MAIRRSSETTEPVYQQQNTPNYLVPSLVLVLAALAFALGALWQRVEYLQKGGLATTNTPTTAGTPAAAQPAPVKASLDQVKDAFEKTVIKFGKADSKLVILEVADPSCPYCHAAAGKDPELSAQMGDQFKLVSQGGTYVAPVPEIKKLVDQGKASFAYVYFPGHANGEMATKAMYCGFEMDKFWEVHDLLMSNAGYNLINNTVKNDKTKSGELSNFLAKAANASQLKKCLDSGKYDSALTTETNLARSIGAQGTPGFFVNEQVFPGAYNYNDMKSAVDSALQ